MNVDVRPRQWKDKAYPQLVLFNKSVTRDQLPPLVHPPEGSKEHALAQHNDQKQKHDLDSQFTPEEMTILKNPNYVHLGTESTGFILVLSFDYTVNPESRI